MRNVWSRCKDELRYSQIAPNSDGISAVIEGYGDMVSNIVHAWHQSDPLLTSTFEDNIPLLLPWEKRYKSDSSQSPLQGGSCKDSRQGGFRNYDPRCCSRLQAPDSYPSSSPFTTMLDYPQPLLPCPFGAMFPETAHFLWSQGIEAPKDKPVDSPCPHCVVAPLVLHVLIIN